MKLRSIHILGSLAVALLWTARAEPASFQGGPPAGLQGPRYFANLQIKDGDDVLPPGKEEKTKKVEFDTGSPVTLLSRACAKDFGLLKADDSDNGFSAGCVGIGGVVGGNAMAHYTKKLSLCAKGLKADGTDNDKAFKKAECKRVVYPKKGEPDLDNLLGTNYVRCLGACKPELTPGGDLKLDNPPPKEVKPKRVRLDLEVITPREPDWHPRRIVPDVHLGSAIQADFILVTGSPYTILSGPTAAALGAPVIGSYDLYNLDPAAFDRLVQDEFFDDFNPGPFAVVRPSLITVPTELGPGLAFSNVPVLVNPFSTSLNVFGSSLLHSNGLPTVIDFVCNTLQYEVLCGGSSSGDSLESLASGPMAEITPRRIASPTRNGGTSPSPRARRRGVPGSQSLPLDTRYIGSSVGGIRYDLSSGEITRVIRPAPRGATANAPVGGVQKASVNCFLNTVTTGYFATPPLGAEWVDWASKATGKTITTSVIFGYATLEADPSAGGPGACLELAFYSGTTGFCTLGTETDRLSFVGLPGATASVPPGYGVGYFVTAFLGQNGICVPDGRIGWGYCSLDSDGSGGALTGPILTDFGTNTGWNDAFDWWSACPANTGTCVGAFFFGGCSTGAVPPPPTGVPCASFMLGLTEWVPLTVAACTSANPGVPANPAILAVTSPPVIGGAFVAVIGAPFGAAAITPGPFGPFPLSGLLNGFLLCNISTLFGGIQLMTPSLVIPLPKDVTLEGFTVCVQAARFNFPGNWSLTNRQDCIFGG